MRSRSLLAAAPLAALPFGFLTGLAQETRLENGVERLGYVRTVSTDEPVVEFFVGLLYANPAARPDNNEAPFRLHTPAGELDVVPFNSALRNKMRSLVGFGHAKVALSASRRRDASGREFLIATEITPEP